MDNLSLITLAVLAISGTTLALLLKRKTAKKQAGLLQELALLAAPNNGTVDKFDFWSGFNTYTKIGVDSRQNHLYYVRSVQGNVSTQIINLNEIKEAKKHCSYKTVGEGKNQQSVVNVVGITLSSLTPKQPDTFLEFFNSKYDNLIVTIEIETSVKWEAILSGMIKTDVATKQPMSTAEYN